MTSFVIVISMLLAATGLGSSAQGENTDSSPAVKELAQQIADLSSPSWQVREDSMWNLMDNGMEVVEPLRVAFERTITHDTRRRIKEIVREIYLTDKLGPPMAFLGISHNRFDLNNLEDGRILPGRTALRIETVFPGTAADRAGLQAGDLLCGLNDSLASVDDPASNMIRWIASQRPGTQCRLRIFRGGSGARYDLNSARGLSSARFARLKLLEVMPPDDPLVPAGASGLRIIEAAKVADDIQFEAGDLIVALDDQLLPARESREAFAKWIGRVFQATANNEDVEIRIQAGRPQLIRRGGPSFQVIRGGQHVEVAARLGRRPIFLRSSGAPAWQAEASAVEAATLQFEKWWVTTFDPAGRLPVNANVDPAWRLEPRPR